MSFKWLIICALSVTFYCEAFDSGLFACKLALNPFSTFQPSRISKGDIEEIRNVHELNNGSRSEVLQFLKKLKYAKFVGAAGVALVGLGMGRYVNELFVLAVPIMAVPTVTYIEQLNQFEKNMKQETKILGIKAYHRP